MTPQSTFIADKYSNISTENPFEDFLDYLVHTIIKDKKSRTFMGSGTRAVTIHCVSAVQARILHPLNVEWSHPHVPGEPYGSIRMDYGTYASFRGTRSEPRPESLWPMNDLEYLSEPNEFPADYQHRNQEVVYTL